MKKVKLNNKEIKGEAGLDYDAETDALYVYAKDIKYVESIDLDDIILDIGENGIIKGIEILDASKKFKLNKYDLKHIKKLIAEIEITPDVIKLKITISVLKRNKEIERFTTAKGLNDISLPSGVVCVEC
ncbi:DUF2283 domain-containing protein [Methanotorris formicicus]|uniref:DUF2283 domain-containing protein n=1 Tax=Methanotorris formicicus Mc-S-70 TaxID=647171 RepID=H1KX92_9EURY|nr:DUF2283 domain-containing protein [Methanotorris formicicus]EHP88523.1 Protein of unknown function DUF2283 [Methanotorris formicicus Mc-S-70]